MAGFLAGVAGALFAFFGRYASAAYMFYQVSGEALCGRLSEAPARYSAPSSARPLFIIIREVVSTHWEHHSLIVGVMAILVVILAPRGLVGLWRDRLDRFDKDTARIAGGPNLAGAAMSAPILETRGLTRRFGGLTAVDNLSLSLEGGKLHAIIGPNGAGKTTLFNLVSGLLRPDSGEVLFRGRDITGLPAHEISRLGIKRTLQVKSVFPSLSVAENLWITYAGSKRFLHPFRNAGSDRVARERVAQTLEQIGLTALAHRAAGVLSYGDVALLEIGMALFPNRSCCCSMNRPAA